MRTPLSEILRFSKLKDVGILDGSEDVWVGQSVSENDYSTNSDRADRLSAVEEGRQRNGQRRVEQAGSWAVASGKGSVRLRVTKYL